MVVAPKAGLSQGGKSTFGPIKRTKAPLRQSWTLHFLAQRPYYGDPIRDGGAAGGAPEAQRPAGIGDADDGRRGRDCGVGEGSAGPPARGCEPPKGRTRAPRPSGGPYEGPGCRGQRARQATADRAPRGGCSALRVETSLPLVCNDRFGGLDRHGGNYLHWFVTALVNSQSGN